jgi:ATP-dependent DNA helicase RecG
MSAVAKERLGIIRDTQDGFEIARRDLLLRGPGEFLGARQSGLPMLRFADLERDSDLLEIARRIAAQMLEEGAAKEINVNRHLDRWLGGRTALATV